MVDEPTIRLLGSTRVGPPGAETQVSGLVERVLWELVLAMPEPVPVHAIVRVLWDDAPPDTWDSAMRTHVARLKKRLADVPGAPAVVHVREGYALDGDRNAIDIYRFQTFLDHAAVADSPTEARVWRDRAATLWHGTPFRGSADTDSADWTGLVDLTSHLVQAFEENELERNLLAVQLGDSAVVLDRLLERFNADPTEITVVEPLVEARLALGRLSDAKEALARHRAGRDAKGLPLQAGAVALERRMLRSELSTPAGRKLYEELPPLLRQDKLLVGRQTEATVFDAVLQTDDTAFVVLQGPAGIGKSHLAVSFAKAAHSSGIPVLATWAEEHSPPLQALTDLLEPWAETLGNASTESLELLLSALVDLSPSRRVLVVFDDLHFADLATTKLLRRVVRRKPIDGVTFVFTVRDVFRNPSVDQLLGDLAGLETARFVQVGPLTLDDTFDLVSHVERLAPAAAWTRAARLHRMSAGFPLVLDFLISDRHGDTNRSFATDLSRPDDQIEGAISETREGANQPVDAAAMTLLAASRLADSDLDIVVTGALLGLVIDVPVLVDAVSLSIAQVHDALDRAYSAGLTDQRTDTSVRFRHPLIRRALWQSRSAVWRCDRSKRLAEVLARRSADVFAICNQLALSIANETSNRVLREVFDGVGKLHELNRWEEAFSLLESVEATVVLAPWWVEPEDTFRYHLLLALSADGCADGDLARAHFRKAMALAKREQRADWVFEVAVGSSGSSQPLDGDSERADWLRAAFDPDAGLDDNRRIQALSEFVYLRALAAADAEVDTCVDEMQRLAATIDDDRARAYHAHGALVAQLSKPNAIKRLEFADRAREWGASVPPEVAATPILVRVFSLLQLGRRSDVDSEIGQIEQLVKLRERPGDQWMMLLYRAMLSEWDGDMVEATRWAEQAKNLAIRHEIHGGREAWGLFQLSRVYRLDDRRTAMHFASDRDDLTLVEQAVAARFLAYDNQTSVANRILDRITVPLTTQPRNLEWLPACLAAGDAAAHTRSPASEALYSVLTPYSGLIVINGLVASSTFGPVDRVLHHLALALADESAAKTFASRVTGQLAASGLSGWTISGA